MFFYEIWDILQETFLHNNFLWSITFTVGGKRLVF